MDYEKNNLFLKLFIENHGTKNQCMKSFMDEKLDHGSQWIKLARFKAI